MCVVSFRNESHQYVINIDCKAFIFPTLLYYNVFFYIPRFSFSHLAGASDTIVMKHTSKSSFCWNLQGLPHGIEVGLNV